MSLSWEQAHSVSIVRYLSNQGIFPVYSHRNGQEYHYHSPIRTGDSTPSFHVNVLKNKWHDKGLGIGGDVIDLIVHHQNQTRSQACHLLSRSGLYSGGYVPEYPPVTKGRYFSSKTKSKASSGVKPLNVNTDYARLEVNNSFLIESIQEVKHPMLLQYLSYRKIDHAIATKYGLKEINYQLFDVPDTEYFALAWINNSGGCEFNRKNFKGCLGIKDINTINLQEDKKLAVFEGFLDFLAYLTYYNITEFESSAVILNSLSLKNKLIEINTRCRPECVYLFWDNDEEGTKATEWAKENILDTPVQNKSGIYEDYKDFNEMVMAL